MYGQQIGTLALLADKQPLWSRTGRQEDEWLRADVILPAGDYMVTLQCDYFTAKACQSGRPFVF